MISAISKDKKRRTTPLKQLITVTAIVLATILAVSLKPAKEQYNQQTIRAVTMLQNDTGIDMTMYADEIQCVQHGGIYYMRAHITHGKETALLEQVTSLCGEGSPASSRKRPILDNGLSDAFEKADLISVYDYLGSRGNGAKTFGITFYTANGMSGTELYVFGEGETPDMSGS